MQTPQKQAMSPSMIDARIRSCFEILLCLDRARCTKTTCASAFAKHIGELEDCFPGFTMQEHVNRLEARLSIAKAVLEDFEAGKVPRLGEGKLGSTTTGIETRTRGKTTTLWDFVSDGGAAAERFAKARIDRARARVDAAKHAVDEAVSTYPLAFMEELPRLLAMPIPADQVDADVVHKRFTALLDVAISIVEGMTVINAPDELLDDLAAELGTGREPFHINADTDGLGELEAVQTAVRELKERLASIEQEIDEPAIDADERRALIAKRGRLEGNLFDLQHRKMELDVRVARKVAEQRMFQRVACLKLLLARARECFKKGNAEEY
ncbi:MAG: hypothetical protein Q6373_004710 [Candidatus Sigynarchaeota archaeon]